MNLETTPRRAGLAAAALTCVLAPLVACGASDASSAADYAGSQGVDGDGSGGGGTTSSTTGAGGAGTTTSTLPPEEHVESSFGAPVATGRYVWIANPSSGRVAYIDATTLAIKIVDAGNAPTWLAAVPSKADEDVAVVLNVLSRDATVLRAKGGALTTASLPVPSSGNAWAVSPDGRWATAWTDARRVESPDPIDGYQDVTVLDLRAGKEQATPLTVGYRPLAMGYDGASKRAFAVTQDGVSVIDLGGDEPTVVNNVPLGPDPLEDASQRAVSITPDGAYALVRREGKATIGVVSLDDASRADVELPGAATDLALSADGSQAVAVVRDLSLVALLPIPAIAADPTSFATFTVPDATVGAVVLATESPVGLLYTTAAPLRRPCRGRSSCERRCSRCSRRRTRRTRSCCTTRSRSKEGRSTRPRSAWCRWRRRCRRRSSASRRRRCRSRSRRAGTARSSRRAMRRTPPIGSSSRRCRRRSSTCTRSRASRSRPASWRARTAASSRRSTRMGASRSWISRPAACRP